MADKITLEEFLEALGLTDAKRNFEDTLGKVKEFGEETNNATKEIKDQIDVERKLQKEFDKLGLNLESNGRLYKKNEEANKKRLDTEDALNKKMQQVIPEWDKLTAAQQTETKSRMASQNALETQLASMNRIIDANGKMLDMTVRMNNEDLKKLSMAKRQEDAIQKQISAQMQLYTSLADLPKKLGVIAVTAAFDLLVGGIMATYRGMLEMQDARIAGREDETVGAILVQKQLQNMADVAGKTGDALQTVGEGLMGLGAALVFVNPLIGLAGLAIGGFTYLLGTAGKVEKENLELQAKRAKQQAEQQRDLFAGYQKLASASMVGARGLQGFYEDLHKMGIVVSQYEKLNKVLQDHQKDVKLFGAGMVDGAKNFSEQAGKLINDKMGLQFEAMGMKQEEIFEHTANFMAQQSRTGAKASGDQTKAAANYIMELDKMAVLTGASRKEQEDARKAILSMNQLRAAILEAESKGDTEKVEELTRGLETASAFVAAGLKAEGTAIAKLTASGGVATDADTARLLSATPEMMEMIRTGKGSNIERMSSGVKGLMNRETQMAGSTKYTGGAPGLTVGEGDLGTLIDLSKSDTKIKEFAAKSGMTPEQYAESQRKPNEDALKAAKSRRDVRAEGLADDDLIKAGGMQMEAAKMMLDAANIFAGNKKAPGTVEKRTDVPMRQAQQATSNQVAANYAKSQMTPEEARNILENGSARDIAAFGGKEALEKLAKGAPAAAPKAAPAAAPKAAPTAPMPMPRIGKRAPTAATAVAAVAPTTTPSTSSGFTAPPGGGPAGSGWTGGSAPAPQSAPSVAAANAELEKYATMTGGALAANITRFESGAAGYNAYNRGTIGNKMIGSDKPIDFSKMTIAEYLKHGNLNSGDPDKIFAMGKYQIIPSTMAGLVKKLKLNPETTFLDSDTQDLLFNEGILKQSRPNVAAYLAGRSNDRDAAILDMAKEFASVGVPYPAGKAKERGESYYAGVGGNKAHNSPEAVGLALDTDRKTKISAAMGGITDGPMSGYPATLHGNEIISPLSPNSILEQLAKTPAVASAVAVNQSNASDILMDLHALMETKFNDMINALKDGNDLTDKLLKYSQA